MNVRISPASMMIGAALAFGAFVLMGQAGPSTPAGSWGPLKKSVVNAYDGLVPPLQPGAYRVLHSVPSDRWLTITGVSIGSGTTGLYWGERYMGIITAKGLAETDPVHDVLRSPAGGSDAVGWVFRPGSEFVLYNLGSSPMEFGHVNFIGYESRD